MQLQPRNRKEKRRKKKTTTKWTNKQQFFGFFFTLGVKGRVMSSQVPKVCNSVHTCSCIAFDNFWRRGRIFIWNYFSFLFFSIFRLTADICFSTLHPSPSSHTPPLPSSPTTLSIRDEVGENETNHIFKWIFQKFAFKKSFECVPWPDSAHKMELGCISVWSVWQEDFYTGCVLLLLLTEGFLSLPLLAAVFWGWPHLKHVSLSNPLCHLLSCHSLCVCLCFRWLCRLDVNLMQQCFVL